jgi:hypothetical protein
MVNYRPAGQDFYFSNTIPELEPFESKAKEAAQFVPNSFRENELISSTKGWVGGAQRVVEVYNTSRGMLLKVEGGGEFFITQHGETINKQKPHEELTKLDREIILGPALVLALALRGVWSLHASAALFRENVIIFLGESGQGKSTLAAYLSQSPGWRLVADDILPVKMDVNGVNVLPRFPQLKLPTNAQPGVDLPEHIPLKTICVLASAESHQIPELSKISTAQAVQSLLSHIAGTRMFDASLLVKHLEFSTQAAKQISVYRLVYPHCRDTLPLVREFLEKIC